MFCDECGDFSDVFSEPTEIIHRQVEHQIRFHSGPREPASDQFAVRMEGVEIALRDWSCARYRRTPRIAVLVCSVQLDQIVEIDVRSMNGTVVRRRDLPKAYQD